MRALRQQDDVTIRPERSALEPGALPGRWINTNAHGRGISELVIGVEHDRVELQAFSARDRELWAWGATGADLLCAANPRSRTAMSFTATYDFGAFQSELQGNLNLGLLVVASFNCAGLGGYDYFAREFFRRGDPAATRASIPWSDSLGRVGGDDADEPAVASLGLPFDGSELFGHWLNTNPDSAGIVRLRIEADGNRAASVGIWEAPEPAGRPAVPAALFALSSGSSLAKAFSARYRTQDARVALQANIKQGVLVVASFTEFVEGSGRSNCFGREFYYRE